MHFRRPVIESKPINEMLSQLDLNQLGLFVRNYPGNDLDRWINDRPRQSEFEDDIFGWQGEFD
jgi:hypothetical protein